MLFRSPVTRLESIPVLATIEIVDGGQPLNKALAAAFAKIRTSGASQVSLLFDLGWRPTMDAVELVAREVAASKGITTLVLVHPSASMSFLASAIAMRVRPVEVRARRSMYDDEDEDEENTDATTSRTLFMMKKGDVLEDFVRRSVSEARSRIVRRFALVFEETTTPPTMDLTDYLAEELLNAGVEEVGLIHSNADLETVAAALRLRLPAVRISFAKKSPPRKM